MAFSAEWLALREPVDLAARESGLFNRAIAAGGERALVLDLGSGTGATARAFGDGRCKSWQWRFVDGDAQLLEIAKDWHPGSNCVEMNLRDLEELPLDGVCLVTASALLDLMPAEWMSLLAARLAVARIPFYAALNYDGLMEFSPAHEADAAITRSFNDHQQTDKGLGPAMGPASGQIAAQILTDHGFEVSSADSPWQLGPDHADLYKELITGIGETARELGNPLADEWVTDRQADGSQYGAVIGHTDILALPRGVA